MKVRSTLTAIFFVTLTAFGVSSIVFYRSLDELSEVQEEAEQASEDVAFYLDLTVSVNRFAKEAVDTFEGEASHEFADSKANAAAQFDAIERRLSSRNKSIARRAHDLDVLAAITRARGFFMKLGEDAGIAGAERQAGYKPDEELFHAALERDYDHGFLAVIDELLADERAHSRALSGEADRISMIAKRSTMTTVFITMMLLAILLGASLRSMDKGIRELVAGAERLADGDIGRRVSTSGDNELGQIGSAFNQMADKLAAAQREKIRTERLSAVGQAAASVGHDLRNPLAAIRNAAHYIRRRVDDSDLKANERVTEFLAIIDRELDTSTKIIGDLLDFARDRRLTASTCPLRSVVAEAISVVTLPKAVSIENLVPDSLPLVTVDKVQLRQALVNLLQNAAESVPEGREGRVEVRAEASARTVTLTIHDNGEGIPPERRASIFEPFFTTKAKGTGLGLAIAAGVINRHRGRIDVDSEHGVGTTFRVEIPIEGPPDRESIPITAGGNSAR